MSDRKVYEKFIEPDPIYNSRIVTLLVNRIMKSGKKTIAQKIVYKTLDIISKKTKKNPILILEKAIKNVSVPVGFKSKRRGRRSIQKVLIKLNAYKVVSIALRWILEFSKDHSGKGMSIKLSKEILIACSGRNCPIIKRKKELLKLAKVNRRFGFR